MQMQTFQIALASLIGKSGLVSGWESDIAGLGEISDEQRNLIHVAASLSAGLTSPGNVTDRLKSIFDSVSLDGGTTANSVEQYYRTAPLALQREAIFPGEVQGKGKSLDEIIKRTRDALPLQFKEGNNYLEEVLSVLHRMTVNLPSSHAADVSYYDQQRMTAALTVCLQEKSQEAAKYLSEFDKYKSEPVALLVGGDISGIQDFIYTITAKGAAKSLRGRSFYLQLLTEAVLRFVLKKLELPYTNVIYSGGGHFFLLAPLSAAGELDKIQREITQAILKHHGTSLYLALGHAEIPVGGFFDGNFPTHWSKMHGALARAKQRRYSELGSSAYPLVFAPSEHGGNPADKCDVCGEDHRKTRPWGDTNDQDRICSLCYSFFDDLGRKLSENNFILLKFGSSTSVPKGTVMEILSDFGMTFEFINSPSKITQQDESVLWSFGDPDFSAGGLRGLPVWLRYTVNRVTDLQFDELQKQVVGGFERLGVLRMDVDNLGELFKNGLGKDATLTRLASLSFRISLFFEGWLKALCEDEKYKGLIYTVYSGGDDVFLIGPWDLMPELAKNIASDFADYTSGNPAVHLSAGMTFIDGKYPVYQAAEDAKDAIDDAKDLDGKNAFTFLGEPWKWAVFDTINQKQNQLSNLVKPKDSEKKPAPQALLQVMQQIALEEQEHKDKKQKGRHVWGRWIWMGMYQLTRMGELNKSTAGDIREIRDNLAKNNYQEIHQWGIAARWTQLKERKKSKKEDAK